MTMRMDGLGQQVAVPDVDAEGGGGGGRGHSPTFLPHNCCGLQTATSNGYNFCFFLLLEKVALTFSLSGFEHVRN